MAAASIAFRRTDPLYAEQLRGHAYQLFSFAVKYHGKYDSSVVGARIFYDSYSGYNDELLWAAVWCFKASWNEGYLKYLADNGEDLEGTTESVNMLP